MKSPPNFLSSGRAGPARNVQEGCGKTIDRLAVAAGGPGIPVKGFSRLDVHNMEELGMSNPPPVELSVDHHLNPNRRAAFSSASASLPRCGAHGGDGETMDAGTPNPALWEEICVIADLNLRTSRGAVQSCGCSMGLAVVGERALWLGLSGLSDREKVDFLDAPVEPKALFGASVTAMRQRCDLRKQEGEAFQACLPRRPIPKGPPSARPGFDALLRSGQPAFRSTRPPQPQQSDVQPKPAQLKGKPFLCCSSS
ncbi:hypothetical protein QQF64_036138 [Cirrhinus molitorella]|uniref:Uncharacterized protein n=1 Tax=Cirrhinus molitorella TaxID=172907 RepID=A0ABR3NHV2_9TELE